MIILQISPEFTPGTGVGGVANSLEQEWLARGHDVRRFDLHSARCSWLGRPVRSVWAGRVQHVARVTWFSTVGTALARKAVRDLPQGAVSICHNDALAGDVYVNHGVLTSAMRARGNFVWRMVRNPLHLFTAARDVLRYRTRTHQRIVSLSLLDRDTLVSAHGLAASRIAVIPNGVDPERFPLVTEEERLQRRQALRLPVNAQVAVFVGHEFDRKGLPLLLEAAANLPELRVVVVGGSPRDIAAQRAQIPAAVDRRVHWAGRVEDPRPYLAVGDVLVLPSAYEANPLVVLEALACGLQVISTRVGAVPQVLEDEGAGMLIDRSASEVTRALVDLAQQESAPEERRRRARRVVDAFNWSRIADRYVDLFTDLLAQRGR